VLRDELYGEFKKWCDENGHDKKSKPTFGRDLRAAVPGLSSKRPRHLDDYEKRLSDEAEQKRPRLYSGIRLRRADDNA
jgi:hypothetical protein